tara:strand:- start:27496 stop:27696 length:201 start_codon:yes stop_codon:yes gene_type:complete
MKRPIDGILPTATWKMLCDSRLARIEFPKSRTHALADYFGKWYIIENISTKKQKAVANHILKLLGV